MLPELDELVRKNWVQLMQINNMQDLAKKLIEKKVYDEAELDKIFSTPDERHNRRRFLFDLREKDDNAFHCFVDILIESGYNSVAELLTPKLVLRLIPEKDIEDADEEEEDEESSSIELEYPYENNDTTPLDIRVKEAEEFYDSPKHNTGGLLSYNTRSKERGRVLLINNYDFPGTKHKYRTGAEIDEKNLEQLFTGMGGWVFIKHSNLTTEAMRSVLKDFAKNKAEKQCDSCFVFILSHGSQEFNRTVIYGTDGTYMYSSQVQDYFTNHNCKLFKGKPKVFIYQVCRGSDIDIPVHHTELDGKPIVSQLRSVEDMFIGYATLPGFKAHRDTKRGTWYIELICRIFMERAKDQSVDNLLMLVDQGLSNRMSEDLTMQTSETKNRGFKKFYLNPGIYEENGVLKRFKREKGHTNKM